MPMQTSKQKNATNKVAEKNQSRNENAKAMPAGQTQIKSKNKR